MKTRSKFLLASLAATLLLGLAVGTASATRLEVSNQGIRIVFLLTEGSGGGPLELANNVGLPTVRCSVTLEGTLHSRTITKTSGLLIGYITRAAVDGTHCLGGSATVDSTSLPWHVRYQSFTGTLPTITFVTVQLIGARFSVTPTGGPTCNARTTAAQPATGRFGVNAGELTEVLGGGSIGLEGPGLCAFGTGTFGGTSHLVTLLGSTTKIRLRLVA